MTFTSPESQQNNPISGATVYPPSTHPCLAFYVMPSGHAV
jgi:hypothetical protein